MALNVNLTTILFYVFILSSQITVFADCHDGNEWAKLNLPVTCPEFEFDKGMAGGKRSEETARKGAVESGMTETAFAQDVNGLGKLEVILVTEYFKTSRIARRWAKFRLTSTDTQAMLKEVILDRRVANLMKYNLKGAPPQSYPAFFEGYFAGIEFPAASTRVVANELLIGYRPGVKIKIGQWYESKKAVYGLAPVGKEEEVFERYITSNRPQPRTCHFNYNSWWTTGVPFNEQEVLELIATFDKNLYKPYGIAFDTFTLDLGWSDPNTIWEISKKHFPQEFANLDKSLRKMNSRLGIWMSPSNFYSPASLDAAWAKSSGYETMVINWGSSTPTLCCMAGEKYLSKFTKNITETVGKYGIKHIKIDGFSLDCPDANHGHGAGIYSSDALVSGGIRFFEAVRKVSPDIWIETTCFGNGSPWWLFYVNSVIGFHGDDAPYGRIACPVYRESYTTSRDYHNIIGTTYTQSPIGSQEVLGIVHQTNDPFMNDAVMTVMRGHAFLPLYINPKFMNKTRWKMLADLLKWTRANSDILQRTKVIFPKSWVYKQGMPLSPGNLMPREAYGYAHGTGKKSIVALRNPWIKNTRVELDVNESIGIEKTDIPFHGVSIYPEARVYTEKVLYGQKLIVELGPYETIVLSLSADEKTQGVPRYCEAIGAKIGVSDIQRKVSRVSQDSGKPKYSLALSGSIDVNCPKAVLQVLMEADHIPIKPDIRVLLNGTDAAVSSSSSVDHMYTAATPEDNGWAACTYPPPENWRFMQVSLASGKSSLAMQMTVNEPVKISAWVMGYKERRHDRKIDNMLPAPEQIIIDSAEVLGMVDCNSL